MVSAAENFCGSDGSKANRAASVFGASHAAAEMATAWWRNSRRVFCKQAIETSGGRGGIRSYYAETHEKEIGEICRQAGGCHSERSEESAFCKTLEKRQIPPAHPHPRDDTT